MCVAVAISGAILFLILTPGVLLRIPEKGPLLNAAIVHAVVFGILFYFVSKIIYQYTYVEDFQKQTCNKMTLLEDEVIKIRNIPKFKPFTNEQNIEILKIKVNAILRNLNICNNAQETM